MRNAIDRLIKIREYVKRQIVGRNDLIDVIFLALLTRNHVFIHGCPGTAKTMIAEKVFSFFKGRYFRTQCTKRMSEDYVVGPPDMRLFKNKGEIVHMVDRYLPCADFAFIDEGLDAPDAVLRAILGVLNERIFSKGSQFVKCPLKTAIMASNFVPNSEALEAVEDRFLFRVQVDALSNADDIASIMTDCFCAEDSPRPMSLASLALLQRRVHDVFVNDYIKYAIAFLAVACRKHGLKVSDRRAKWSLEAVKAAAFIEGRTYATFADTAILSTVLAVSEDSTQEQKFAAAVGDLRTSGNICTGAGDASISRTLAIIRNDPCSAVDYIDLDDEEAAEVVAELKDKLTKYKEGLGSNHDSFKDLDKLVAAEYKKVKTALNVLVKLEAKL